MEYGFRKARKQAHMTLRQVAQAIGVSHQSVHCWETGKKSPGLEHLLQLAELYHITLDALVRG